MLDRRTLEAELVELTARAATLTDHMVRAAQVHDAATIQDLTWDLGDVEKEIDQRSFELACIQEAERA